MSLSLSQYLLYLQYMLAGIAMTVVFGAVYLRITPVEELRLIKNGTLPAPYHLAARWSVFV